MRSTGVLAQSAAWAMAVVSLVMATIAVASEAQAKAKGPAAASVDRPGASPSRAPAVGSNARWLWSDDRSESWKSSTARCRELLDRLSRQEPLTVKYLPRIREKCRLLLRTGDFDWKKATAVDWLANLLEDVLAGKEPYLRYRGKGLGYPYWSDTVQRIEATWVHVPPDYDPAKSYQLFLYYKCGGGIHNKDGKAAGGYRPTAEVANQTDTFHAWSSLNIQVKGRMGAHVELEEFPAALAKDFSVDGDRVFLTGWSDGGFTAVWLASHYPHLVAGIAPLCANWQYSNVENLGLLNLPTLALDGWGDGGYNNLQFCRWQVLRNLGGDASCIWAHHGHEYKAYEDLEEFRQVLDWAKGHKRDLWPKRVYYATWNLHWNRAYWVSIDRMTSPVLAAEIEAEIKPGNRIEVRCRNVAAYRLSLGERLVDVQKPVRVFTGGKESYSGPAKAELAIEVLPPPAGNFVKSAAMPDEIAAVTLESSYDTQGFLQIPARRWLAVKPTGWDEKTARLLAKWAPQSARADVDVTEDDLAKFNLIVYGGPAINKLTARMAGALPVKIDREGFTVGNRRYGQPTHCVAFLHPNPLNPKKYVIVYAFNDAAAFAKHGYFGMTGESVWKFRSGDCVVSGIPARRPKWGVALDDQPFETHRTMFDNAWQPDASPPLAVLAKPLDYLQVLRLKAEAIREAAGAEVGVIWDHTPGWNRWGTSLPAGPVTLSDLAMLDMLPEYVLTAQVAGAELVRGGHSPAAASTLFADPREPGYDPKTCLARGDIDPKRTYRVAMGHFGLPSYGAEPGKMPKLFRFATGEDFQADPHNRVILHGLRQLPLQVIEATGDYLRKRQRFSPRPMAFDLAEYVFNREDNDFGACDWLHLGMDVSWQMSDGLSDDRRYSLGIGLRLSDQPKQGPGRSNAKKFLDLGRDAKDAAAFDFGTLDKNLGVTAECKVRRFALAPDGGSKSCRLVAEGDAGAIGRGLLVEVRLSNRGPGEVAGMAVLSENLMRRFYVDAWPDERQKDARYAGYHRSVGPYQQPPLHEDAALLLSAGPALATTKLILPGAGYGVGLVGFSTPLDLKPGEEKKVPLLLVSVNRPKDRPEVKLAEIVQGIQPQLLDPERR